MKIVGFDTETTGFTKMDIDPSSIEQPWPVQIAAKMVDENNVTQCSMNFLINPPIPVEAGALAAHGITQDRLMLYGVKPITAVTMLYSMIARADIIVGHNLGFDINIIKLAKLRLGISHHADLFDGKIHFCTQQQSAHILKLPPTEKMMLYGMQGMPKSPTLAEAYQFFFGEKIIGAHDAMNDTEAALRIYFEIKRREKNG